MFRTRKGVPAQRRIGRTYPMAPHAASVSTTTIITGVMTKPSPQSHSSVTFPSIIDLIAGWWISNSGVKNTGRPITAL